MKKLLLITLSIINLLILTGCGCESEPETIETIDVLGEDFQGPTEPPFSVGPSGPPPGQ